MKLTVEMSKSELEDAIKEYIAKKHNLDLKSYSFEIEKSSYNDSTTIIARPKNNYEW